MTCAASPLRRNLVEDFPHFLLMLEGKSVLKLAAARR